MGRMLNGKKKKAPSKIQKMVEVQLQGIGVNIQNPCDEVPMSEVHDRIELRSVPLSPTTQKWIDEFISTKGMKELFDKKENTQNETSPGACYDFWRDGDW